MVEYRTKVAVMAVLAPWYVGLSYALLNHVNILDWLVWVAIVVKPIAGWNLLNKKGCRQWLSTLRPKIEQL